jgi:peptidoglycan hydrolase-like protein with peptidoglycan-binding domain
MTKSLVIALVVAVGGAAGLTAWWLATPRHTGPATAVAPVATATVVRTNLATTTQMSGTIGYADSYTIPAQLSGTITALPGPGAIVTRGHTAFEVDGSGVFLFYGTRPAWRSFGIDMTPGPDVLELEQNLAALGYAGDIEVDNTFTWGTDEAVRRWQLATGQLDTGRIELGRITFQPGPVRVNSDETNLGGAAEPGQPVISASSPDPVVNVPVPAAQTFLVHPGDRVTVTMPSGTTSTGRVARISSIATPATGSSEGGGGQSSAPNNPQPAAIPAVVSLDHPAAAAYLDAAPVTVNVTDRRVSGVLAVPVTALVALAGGGYGVWVHAAGSRHIVAVTTGLFANALVQVTASQLQAGDLVEVPAP